MKFSFFVLFILCSIHTHLLGQMTLEELKKDPDVVWISIQEVSIGLPSEMSGHARIIQSPNHESATNWLPSILWDAIINGKTTAYTSSDMNKSIQNKPIAWQHIKVPSCHKSDSTTLESVMKDTDIYNAVLRTVVYYKRSNAQFGIIPLALGFKSRDLMDCVPVLWITVGPSNQEPNINDLNVAYIWSENSFDIELENKKYSNFTLVKKTIKKQIGKEYLQFCNSNTIKAENLNNEPLDKIDFNASFSSTDTITTYSPETFEEIVTVQQVKWNLRHVNGIRMELMVYWDCERNKLYIYQQPIVAPLFRFTHATGNMVWRWPHFYHRY